MALTTKELLSRTQAQYHLTKLVGGESLDHIVTWVHMLEDTSVAEFFWGNELVVSCGYSAHDAAGLLHFLDELAAHRCAGVVLNTGKYIDAVPQEVIRHCQEIDLPLYTMPWTMFMTEFVRTCCSLINKSNRDDDDLAAAALRVIHSPHESGADQTALRDYFNEKAGFQMLAVHIDTEGISDERLVTLHQRITLRLHTALRPYAFSYLIFRHNMRFLVLLNQSEAGVAQQIANRILALFRESEAFPAVHIGIGDPVAELYQLDMAYHAAISAQRRALLQQQAVVRFCDMSFYKLLYSVPRDSLLLDYYRETIAPVADYDRENGTAYTETLFRYLLTDGSLQAVATAMYTHRNTINYRMAKIRELLNNPLETQKQRMPYLIAYHAGVILKQIPEWEA